MRACPICKKHVAPRAENAAFPFCSDRCKLIDLGKWLGGEYRLASRADDGEAELPTEDPRQRGASPEGDDA